MVGIAAVAMENSAQAWLYAMTSGIASALGAATLYLDPLLHGIGLSSTNFNILDSHTVLSAMLSGASGIMAYTSISVLTEESIEYLSRTPDESIVGKVAPGLITAVLFVIGAFLNLLLIKVVSWITPADSPIGHACASHPPTPTTSQPETGHGSNSGLSTTDEIATTENSSLLLGSHSRCHSHIGLAIGGDNQQGHQASSSDSIVVSNLHGTKCQSGERCEYACTDRECYNFEHCHITPLFPHTHTHTHTHSHTKSSSHSLDGHSQPSLQLNGSDNGNHNNNSTAHISSQHQRLLVHVGLQTAVAIALHKIPEGLIIYLSRQASPKLGLSVAASLFFHNLPEGLMLALPLFLATGRRHVAFMLSSLMGAAPPAIGAALGMWLLAGGGSSNGDGAPDRSSHDRFAGMFGIAFGITAGMMCMVSLNGMLPTARIYDKSGNVVSWCFAMGVAAMIFANSVFK